MFLLGFLVCAGLGFGALKLHFIQTRKGFVIWPKTDLTLEDTYADTRNWGPVQYLKHPRIALALLERKKAFSKDHYKEMERSFKKNRKEFEKSLEKELDKLEDFLDSK